MGNYVKINFTLDLDVAEAIHKLNKGERSKWVNQILKKHLQKDLEGEMAEGFEQPTEDFNSWEKLGFETWK